MKDRRDVELAGGVLAGALMAWSLPEAWFGKALLVALGVTLTMGVLAAAAGRAYFLFGNVLALRGFLLSAALAVGLLVGIFLL